MENVACLQETKQDRTYEPEKPISNAIRGEILD